MLESVEWGEYRLGDLFDSYNGDFDIQKTHINGRGDYVITAGVSNNGILGKTDVKARVFDKGTITIDMFGHVFYRQFSYKMVTHARVFSLIPKNPISIKQGVFISGSMFSLSSKFGYENMCSWAKIQDEKILLPTRNGKIDFEFMERFIAELHAARLAELHAYLSITGLKDYTLTPEEEQAVKDFEAGNVEWGKYHFEKVFNHIKQGRRLKKDDQKEGAIPFVMAGTSNTGVVNYISNPIATFPSNSITIDIFGNTFYRNYGFGAGDDTGVYWDDQKNYSKELMLFFTTAMSRALVGKYSFGKKLRSSQSLKEQMFLLEDQGSPAYGRMETFISAIQKLVIKDVVLYSEKEFAATRRAIQ